MNSRKTWKKNLREKTEMNFMQIHISFHFPNFYMTFSEINRLGVLLEEISHPSRVAAARQIKIWRFVTRRWSDFEVSWTWKNPKPAIIAWRICEVAETSQISNSVEKLLPGRHLRDKNSELEHFSIKAFTLLSSAILSRHEIFFN